MSPLFDKVTGALRDARSARSSGSVGAERSLRSAGERSDASSAVVCQGAALLLAYPEAELLNSLDVIESAVAATSAAQHFAPVLAHLRSMPLRELQSFHVQEFDLSRRHALHVSYWTDGDTRRRGEVLAEIKGIYRESGLVVALERELPDYLPVMLEFAVADPDRGLPLLERFRASLELLRIGLADDRLPHAGVLAALCNELPGVSPKTRAEVQAMVDEVAPLEMVGISSFEHAQVGPSPTNVTWLPRS
ncbi:MAG TPA: nitrate reductase molybdenum cofactor assembly chaperone [Propionicimonas sp.]